MMQRMCGVMLALLGCTSTQSQQVANVQHGNVIQCVNTQGATINVPIRASVSAPGGHSSADGDQGTPPTQAPGPCSPQQLAAIAQADAGAPD